MQYSSPGYPLFRLHGSGLLVQGLPHEPRRSEHASGKRAPPAPSSGVEGSVPGVVGVVGTLPGAPAAPAGGVTGAVGDVPIEGPVPAVALGVVGAGLPAVPVCGPSGAPASGVGTVEGPSSLESPQPKAAKATMAETQILDFVLIKTLRPEPHRLYSRTSRWRTAGVWLQRRDTQTVVLTARI